MNFSYCNLTNSFHFTRKLSWRLQFQFHNNISKMRFWKSIYFVKVLNTYTLWIVYLCPCYEVIFPNLCRLSCDAHVLFTPRHTPSGPFANSCENMISCLCSVRVVTLVVLSNSYSFGFPSVTDKLCLFNYHKLWIKNSDFQTHIVLLSEQRRYVRFQILRSL